MDEEVERTLQLRLARGEISPDDYAKTLRLLSKNAGEVSAKAPFNEKVQSERQATAPAVEGGGEQRGGRWKWVLAVLIVAGFVAFFAYVPNSPYETRAPDTSRPREVRTRSRYKPGSARQELAKLNLQYTPSAFLASAANGDRMAVELYLAAGMDVNTKNENGATALMEACSKGHKDLVVLLLASSAELDARLDDGTSPLLMACEQGHRDIALFLLNQYKPRPQRGFGYNEFSGSTPMKWAAKNGWTDVVVLLLNKGVDDLSVAHLEDSDNKTALDYAKEGGHTEIVRRLQEVHDRAEKRMGR